VSIFFRDETRPYMLKPKGFNVVWNLATGHSPYFLRSRDSARLLRSLRAAHDDAEVSSVFSKPHGRISNECRELRAALVVRLPRSGRPVVPLREALDLDRFAPSPFLYRVCCVCGKLALTLAALLIVLESTPSLVGIYFLATGVFSAEARDRIAGVLASFYERPLRSRGESLTVEEPSNVYSLDDFVVYADSRIQLRPLRFHNPSTGGSVHLLPTLHTAEHEFYMDLLRRFTGPATVLLESIGWGLNIGLPPAFRASLESPENAIEHFGRPARWRLSHHLFGLTYQSQLHEYIAACGRRTLKQTAKASRRGPGEEASTPSGVPFVYADLKFPSPATLAGNPLLAQRNELLLSHITDEGAAYVVPWGVAHMPYLATELKRRGFVPEWGAPVVALDFRKQAEQFLQRSAVNL